MAAANVPPIHYIDQLLSALDKLGLALMVYHIEGGATSRWYTNQAAAALTGRSVDELIQQPLLSGIAEEDRARVNQMIQEAAEGKTQAGVVEMIIAHPDGRKFPAEVSFVVERRATDAIVFTFMRDVSSERKQQLRFIEADRRRLIATIASGLAHEVFNPLTYVQLNLGRIQRLVEAGDPSGLAAIGALVTQIEHGLTRTIQTVQKVGELTGIYPSEATACCLVRVAHTAIALLQPNILARATVHDQLLEAPAMVHGDASTVGQAIFSALLFAASGPGASTDLEDTSERRRIDLHMTKDGDYVILTVADNGPHLSDNELVQIFQPFSSTRRAPDNEGLAVAKGLIERIGGYVYAMSAPARGLETRLAFRSAEAPSPRPDGL